jgi:hypothetical protein
MACSWLPYEVLVLQAQNEKIFAEQCLITEERKGGQNTMRRAMRWFSSAVAVLLIGGFLLTAAPGAAAGQIRRRVIVVEPFYPYYPWGYYPYAYPGYYAPANYGEVKIETHRKDLAVYIDGGYAAEIRKNKKFTLRPGNHQIELRDSDGQTVYQERVAVTIGKTVKLQVL